MDRRRRSKMDDNYIRENKRDAERRHRRKIRRRRETIIRILVLLFIIFAVFFSYKKLISSNKKQVGMIQTAIKNDDEEYFSKKMDRMAVIMDVLKKSYSKDDKENKEFYQAVFSNLSINYIEEKSVEGGKEVSLEIENVNYIDVYKALGEDKSHEAYMKALKNKDAPRKKARVSIFIRDKIFSKKIYESRPFVNAILGGALDYAK